MTFATTVHPRDLRTGRFVTSLADGDPRLEGPVTVRNSAGELVTLNPTRFGWEATEVYAAGQCAALAYALADEFPDATIKVALNRSGTTLIHAWLEDDGIMIDAYGWGQSVDMWLDDTCYQWGTPQISDHTPESLRDLLETEAPGVQDWTAAARMVPAWRRVHFG